MCDRSPEGLAQTKTLIDENPKAGGHAIEVEVVTVDVSSEDSVTAMVQAIVKRWGRIDYAVNAAGMCRPLSYSGRNMDLFFN